MLQDIRYNIEKQKGMTDLQLRLSQMEEKAEKLRKMGLLFFCPLLFDIASMGAGKYLPLGWFSFRILLTILVLCCGLPLIFIRFRSLIRKPPSLLFLVLLVYLGMETLRGLLLDNSRAVLLSDVKGFAWLGLIPLLQVLIKDRSDLRRAVNFGLAGASFQAAVCVLFNILFAGLIPRSLPSFVEWIWKIQWGTILQVEYNAVRIFCRSSMYLVVACVILWGRLMRSEKLSLKYALLFLLNFFALFYTYTRSMYLTLLAGLLLAFVYTCLKYPLKRVLMRSLILAGVFLILSVFSDIVLRQGSFQYAVARCFHRDLQQMLHLQVDGRRIDDTALKERLQLVVVEMLAVVLRVVRIVRDHDGISRDFSVALRDHADVVLELAKGLFFGERRVQVFVGKRLNDGVLQSEDLIEIGRVGSSEINEHWLALAIHYFISER